MPTTKTQKGSLADIARRATLRKANPNLRHAPNENDLQVASEHANLMIYHQYQTINPDKEDN